MPVTLSLPLSSATFLPGVCVGGGGGGGSTKREVPWVPPPPSGPLALDQHLLQPHSDADVLPPAETSPFLPSIFCPSAGAVLSTNRLVAIALVFSEIHK